MLTRRTCTRKSMLRRIALAAIVILAIFTAVVFISNPTPLAMDRAPVIAGQKAIVGLPIRLTIPAINISSGITYVGLTPDGAMDVKKDPTAIMWYEFGPRPGEIGSAVIAGHYGWTGSEGSIFNDLHKLNKGDKIAVTDNNDVTTNFVVRESRRYSPKADATDVFISNDGKSHLNLITCDGVWKDDQNTYSNRLVVFADKE